MTDTNSATLPARTDDRRLLPRAERGRRETDRAATELVDERQGIRQQLEERPGAYFTLLAAAFVIGLLAIRHANMTLAPLLYDQERIAQVASHLSDGRNYATYDLNVEMRGVRRESIRHLDRTPQVAVLGASHWQEGHAELAPSVDLYNAHVHRDYYEDPLAVVGMMIEAGRLPPQLIITIRDNLFTPVAERTDFLWLPAIPDYRRMARRLGIEPHPIDETLPMPQLRQSLSLILLKANIERWWSAPVQPQPTADRRHPTLDLLLPDGSIIWSDSHRASYTPESAIQKALSFAQEKRNSPPMIDPIGVDTIDRLLTYLAARDVEVYLAHPPFNPVYFDAVRGSPYAAGLERIEQLTRDLAAKHGLEIIGSFDPAEVGCSSEQYIDAEHANPTCLANIINEFVELDLKKRAARASQAGRAQAQRTEAQRAEATTGARGERWIQ